MHCQKRKKENRRISSVCVQMCVCTCTGVCNTKLAQIATSPQTAANSTMHLRHGNDLGRDAAAGSENTCALSRMFPDAEVLKPKGTELVRGEGRPCLGPRPSHSLFPQPSCHYLCAPIICGCLLLSASSCLRESNRQDLACRTVPHRYCLTAMCRVSMPNRYPP